MNIRKVLAIAVVACLALAGCSGSGSEAPTEDDAQEFVRELVIAATSEAGSVCDLATSSNCDGQVQGMGSAPSEWPEIICSSVHDESATGMRLVRLDGVLDSGESYSSQIGLIRTSDGVRALNPVYWSNTNINAGDSTEDGYEFCE